MLRRQHCRERIPEQRHRFELLAETEVRKADLDLAALQHRGDARIAHRRVLGFELLHQRGKCLAAHGRKRADAHDAALQLLHLKGFVCKRHLRIADILDVRIHLFAVGRQLDAVFFPQHERQPDLLLNGLDRLTDRALGIVQDLCRFGKALARNSLTEHLILGRQWYHLFL